MSLFHKIKKHKAKIVQILLHTSQVSVLMLSYCPHDAQIHFYKKSAYVYSKRRSCVTPEGLEPSTQ